MLYKKTDKYELRLGKMQEELLAYDSNSIDSIVTDPPYELGFMGKSWDSSGVAFQKETWEHCYRVLKPGGYLLAFGGSRTYHRIACAIEDAGFEIRDTIQWLYGCLSEDSEVLTRDGFKTFKEIKDDEEILIYDIENKFYKWEKPERWNEYHIHKDTMYNIKSDTTNQLVSRNHRCPIERDGELIFEYAENLHNMERVPVLPYNFYSIQNSEGKILLQKLLWEIKDLVSSICKQFFREEKSQEGNVWGVKSCLEGWGNLLQEKWKLWVSKNKICEMSSRIHGNGKKRWLCSRTSTSCGTTTASTIDTTRMRTSYKPQCRGQQIGKSNVVFQQSGAQTLRGGKTYNTSMATVSKIEYSGMIFCPTVSTGCFVARRDNKIFITGNSGFPKSFNIGLAIDKKNGVESTTVNIGSSGINSRAFQSEETTTAGEYEIKEANNEWNGWGTCLKPAYEPVIVARKPFDTSIVDNIETYGVGGINIDECRVPFINDETNKSIDRYNSVPQHGNNGWNHKNRGANFTNETQKSMEKGRFPANVILTYDDSDFEEVCDGFPETKSTGGSGEKSKVNTFANTYAGGWGHDKECAHLGGLGDEGSAARYFYCAKASKKDRDEGLNQNMNNIHPTVKPTELMQYLVRLVTPRNGIVLDPFMGSGSTGKACMIENKERNVNYKFIGVEMTEEYLPICEARINFGMNYVPDFTPTKTEVINEVKKVKESLW